MQSADTVLGVLSDRGRRGLSLERLHRQLFSEQLFLMAYGRIYANGGAMTPEVDGETPDGVSLGRIQGIIGLLQAERYRFSPVRRVHIPKKNESLRLLGLPTWSDKLVGRWCVSCWRRTTSRSSRPGRTVSARPGLPHRARRDRFDMDGHHLVHRGRHRRLLGQSRPRGHARDPGRTRP